MNSINIIRILQGVLDKTPHFISTSDNTIGPRRARPHMIGNDCVE